MEQMIADGHGKSSQDGPGYGPNRKPQTTGDGWRGLPAVEAVEVDDHHPTVAQLVESATRLADGVGDSEPQAMQQALSRAFATSSDAGEKSALLSSAVALAGARGGDAGPILNAALGDGQPEEVRREALYLAADENRALLENIAATEGHPLQTDAAAFLLEKRVAAGDVPPPVTEEIGEPSPELPATTHEGSPANP